MGKIRLILVSLNIFILFNCATNVQGVLSTSYEKHKDLSDPQPIIDASENVSDAEASNVTLYIDEFPPGIKKTNGGLDLGSKWQVLGNAEVIAGEANGYIKLAFWFVDYDKSEPFRKYYCNAQIPLKILTLTMWTITPFFWICLTDIQLDKPAYVVRRKQLMAIKLQKLARAAGGDAVWIHTTIDKFMKARITKAMILKQK